MPDDLETVLQSATTASIKLGATAPAVGRDLMAVDLRRATGVTLIAAIRDGETIISPARDFVFTTGDILILFGRSENLESAVGLLQGEGSGFNA